MDLSPASHSSSSSSRGFGGERAGELQPLAVDIGEVGRRPPVVPGKADAVEQRVDPSLGLGGGQMRLLERQPGLMFSRQSMPSSTRTSWNVRARPSRAIR